MTDEYHLSYIELAERAATAVARVCELLDDVSKKQAEIDRLQKRVDELEVASAKHLAYAIIGNSTLVVAHPLIMPHEIVHSEGQWYCYPISPNLEKLRGLHFSNDYTNTAE